MNSSNKTIIECDCSAHLLMVTYERYGDNTNQQDINLAIFNYGNKPGWLSRFKYCWKILKTGSPYGDQLVLNPSEANKLKKFISDNLV